MIAIQIMIQQKKDGSIDIKQMGSDINGNTDDEADIADEFKEGIAKIRDKIFEDRGYTKIPYANRYTRSFKSPEERDKRNHNEQP